MSNKKSAKGGASLEDLVSSLPDYFDDNNIVKTNIDPLDKLLGGGLELGSFVQVVAESGLGKSTIMLQTARNLCEQGYKGVYLDSEGSVSKEMLTSTGVIEHLGESFYLIRESTFDNVAKALDKFIATGEVSFIIVDSVADLTNQGYVDITNSKKEVIDITSGATGFESIPLSRFMSKYKTLATKYKVCFILINQYRNLN